MLFPTITFAIFFSVVLVGNWWLMSRPRAWKPFILAASYLFYGAWDHRFTMLLAASTLANQFFARRIRASDDPQQRRLLLAGTVAANLGVLGYFKYVGFLTASVLNGLHTLGWSVSPRLVEVLLPVGISFFTFQALSYVIDVFRGDLEPAPTLDVAVYLSFFPQLVAGPIVRGTEMLPQLAAPRDGSRIDASGAFRLILRGLFKKVVVATYLSTAIVDGVFQAPSMHSGAEVLVGVYAYAIQIYADFSGYTDIAIGCAMLLGFRFPENFDRPYAARSLQDFWRRWHMTLSRWLRDYLYIPLGGSKVSGGRVRRNLMITMVLGGLWHGAAWTFVVWGAIHGSMLVVERTWRRWRPEPVLTGRAARVVPWLATFHAVCFAWVFFRAESFSVAIELLGRLASGWGAPSTVLNPLIVIVVMGALAAHHVPAGLAARAQVAFARLGWFEQAATLALALVVMDALAPAGMAPFIYFQF